MARTPEQIQKELARISWEAIRLVTELGFSLPSAEPTTLKDSLSNEINQHLLRDTKDRLGRLAGEVEHLTRPSKDITLAECNTIRELALESITFLRNNFSQKAGDHSTSDT